MDKVSPQILIELESNSETSGYRVSPPDSRSDNTCDAQHRSVMREVAAVASLLADSDMRGCLR